MYRRCVVAYGVDNPDLVVRKHHTDQECAVIHERSDILHLNASIPIWRNQHDIQPLVPQSIGWLQDRGMLNLGDNHLRSLGSSCGGARKDEVVRLCRAAREKDVLRLSINETTDQSPRCLN